MQILQRLFKVAHEQEKERSTFSPLTNRETISGKSVKGKDIITLKHHRGYRRTRRIKLGSNNLKLFTFICGKDIPKACFYRTVNLNRFENLNNRRNFFHSMKMKREELSGRVGIAKKADIAAHVGKKVMPITEASSSSSAEGNDQFVTTETKDQTKGDKKKPISRTKELLRWAAAAKKDRRGKFNKQKILQFRRQRKIKAPPEDDQLSIESPKISFSWDMEICSFTQISHSPIHITPKESDHFTCRKGNWITTDSEFVVLEL